MIANSDGEFIAGSLREKEDILYARIDPRQTSRPNTASGLGQSNLKTTSDYLEELTSCESAYASQLEDEFGISGRFKSREPGPVILSVAKNLCRMGRGILRYAQNDRAV